MHAAWHVLGARLCPVKEEDEKLVYNLLKDRSLMEACAAAFGEATIG